MNGVSEGVIKWEILIPRASKICLKKGLILIHPTPKSIQKVGSRRKLVKKLSREKNYTPRGSEHQL